jgi:hypothetical protein
MTTITPEQRLAVENAGDDPILLIDPSTNAEYYLIKAILLPRKPSVASMSYLLDELDPADWEDSAKYGL